MVPQQSKLSPLVKIDLKQYDHDRAVKKARLVLTVD